MPRRFIPKYLLNCYHRLSAILADIWYGHPSRKLVVIGVTGTNGKTTTAHFITTVLEARGLRVGLISTIVIRIGGEERVNETKMTSLKNCWQLQRLLAAMVAAGDTYAVVETTSHALNQYRVHAIAYDVAVLTNVTHEHLDYHKTLDRYRKAKERLFAMVASRSKKIIDGKNVPRVTVVNADDPSAPSFLRYRSDVRSAYGFGARPQEVEEKNFITQKSLATPLQIPGRFTLANACAAFAVATVLGIPHDVARHALQSVKGIPGRLERIDEGQSFIAMIDYAVTPDSFEKLAEVVRGEILAKGARWWWVFGATGERDRAKRPILGEIAGRVADFVVLTNEDPFHEDPERILDEVEAGVKKSGKEKEKNYWRTLDRRAAIRYALERAKPGDVVTITGKGAETAMAIGDNRVPWDERQIVREILGEIATSASRSG
ncbi:MAG: UDP-N-acetylmuramoyl-L-alanyl-D-glutamate--2,6-diaminopimelate ligase [bacterium]|nr:UDP-N-acetylmuramoyl-L-alanyl-D-glutamate--2,6-diaminopimelate ligase [bacterium]